MYERKCLGCEQLYIELMCVSLCQLLLHITTCSAGLPLNTVSAVHCGQAHAMHINRTINHM